MKTKQLILMVMLCGPIAVLSTFGQGVYIGIGGGYGFPAAKQSIFVDYKTTTGSSGTVYEETAHPLSLGKGVNAGLYAGYMFNKNVGAEIGFAYLVGGKNTFTDEQTNAPASTSYKRETTWKGRMIRIVPTIRMTAGEKKIMPYMKAGLIIGVDAKMFEETHMENTSLTSTTISDENWKYSGGVSWGFHGGIGLNYKASDKIGIFAEIAANYQNWAMKKGTMTKNTVDGVDQLPMLDTYDKEIEFVDSYSYDTSAAPNTNQPDKSTKFLLPFSSIGLNIGINISFGDKSE